MTAFTFDEHTAYLIVEIIQFILVFLVFSGMKKTVPVSFAIQAFREGYQAALKTKNKKHTLIVGAKKYPITEMPFVQMVPISKTGKFKIEVVDE